MFYDNQTNPAGPRPVYLYPVYALIKRWWEAKVGEFKIDFEGEFGVNEDGESPYTFEACNSQARLVYLIAKQCDSGYTLENCASLPRAFR